MSVRIREDKETDEAYFYDSVDGIAFGPMFPDKVIAQGFRGWVYEHWDNLYEGDEEPNLCRPTHKQLMDWWAAFCAENPSIFSEE